MTHTLHRLGSPDDLNAAYVILAIASQTVS